MRNSVHWKKRKGEESVQCSAVQWSHAFLVCKATNEEELAKLAGEKPLQKEKKREKKKPVFCSSWKRKNHLI